jgi:hypothetical protein
MGVSGGDPFTTALEFIFDELRVPYVLHGVDSSRVPSWYPSQPVVTSITPAVWIPSDAKMLKPDDGDNPSVAQNSSDEYSGKFDFNMDSILKKAMEKYPLQTLPFRIHGTTEAYPSLLPQSFTPQSCLHFGLQYLNQPAFDEGSHFSKANPSLALITGSLKVNAITTACEECIARLQPLEYHLIDNKYCCGDTPGFDDFIRFTVFTYIFDIFAPLWGYDVVFFQKCPRIRKWMRRVGARPSNPFFLLYSTEVEHMLHVPDKALYYSPFDLLAAFGSEWSLKMPNRVFPDYASKASTAIYPSSNLFSSKVDSNKLLGSQRLAGEASKGALSAKNICV